MFPRFVDGSLNNFLPMQLLIMYSNTFYQLETWQTAKKTRLKEIQIRRNMQSGNESRSTKNIIIIIFGSVPEKVYPE